MRTILLSALAVTLLLSSAPKAADDDFGAAGLKPVVVVSLPSYERVMQDIAFFGKMADDPELRTKIEDRIKDMTQGKGLAGLDKSKPWGFVVMTDGVDFRPMAFLPVTNLKELVDTLGTIPGLPQLPDLDEKGNGLYEMGDMTIKQQEGWIFVAQSEESLKDLPADPVKALGTLPAEYELGLRAHVNNIPALYRQMAIGFLQQGAQASMKERLPGEDDDAFALRKKSSMMQIQQFITAINEMDQVTLGWKVDESARKSYFDFAMTAQPESKTAREWAHLSEAKSDNTGFVLPNAAASLVYANKLAQEDIDQFHAMLPGMRSQVNRAIEQENDLPDDAKEGAKEILSKLLDVLQKTVESGKMDAAASLLLEDKTISLVAGAYVADGPGVEEAFKKLVTMFQNQPDFPGVKFNVASHAGVNFHTTSIPVADDEAKNVLGDKVDVVVGIGAKSAYLGLGSGSMEKLTQAIDKSQASPGKSVPPMVLSFAAGPILKYSQNFKEDSVLDMVTAEVEKLKGKDHLTITATPIKNGAQVRIEAEEGVLRAIGIASKLSGDLGGL